MSPKVSLSFARATDGNLGTFTGSVLVKMAGNESFPQPTPALASVQLSLKTFLEDLAEAKDGGRAKTAEKNASREVLLDQLRNLALYVQITSKGDLAVLLSSGFESVKAPTPAGVLPAPVQVSLTQGELSGSLLLRGSPVRNAGSYEGQLTTKIADPESWEPAGKNTAARTTIDGLSPGTQYWGRLRAIGSEGPGAWSEPVSAIAL